MPDSTTLSVLLFAEDDATRASYVHGLSDNAGPGRPGIHACATVPEAAEYLRRQCDDGHPPVLALVFLSRREALSGVIESLRAADPGLPVVAGPSSNGEPGDPGNLPPNVFVMGKEPDTWDLKRLVHAFRAKRSADAGVASVFSDLDATASPEAGGTLFECGASSGGNGFLQSVLDAIQDGIAVLDPGLNILRMNRTMESWYAHVGPPVGRKCYEVFQGRQAPCTDCPSLKALQTGQLQFQEVPFKGPETTEGVMELYSYPLTDSAGRVTGVVEYVRDITQRRRAEAALRLSELLQHAVSEVLLVIDPRSEDGVILAANEAGQNVFGREREEMRGLTLEALVSGEPTFTTGDLMTNVRRVLEEGERVMEWRCKDRTGKRFWAEIKAEPARFEDAQRVLLCIRDISEQKRAEEELLHIREALDDCDDAVVVVDQELRPTYVNVAFGGLFGLTREEARETALPMLFADGTAGAEVVSAVLEGRTWQGEVQMRSRGGDKFTAALRGTPVMDPDFDVVAALFILSDITERKQLEAQVLQSQNLKSVGQLAAGIAHEINTPMQYVGDNMRFLKDGFGDLLRVANLCARLVEEAKRHEACADIAADAEEVLSEADMDYLTEEIPAALAQSLEGSERVTEIVRAMKQFTHPGSEEKQYIDINQAVESTVTVARNEWRYVADVETHFDPGMPMVPCYPGDLNQVVLNLIVNAAHAIGGVVGDGSSGKGTITVSTSHSEDWAEIRIADTGGGIPEAIRDRIFDPFFTTKDVGVGTGQGLSISHAAIADKHGGTLTFETEEGKGTTFIIRVPMAHPETAEEALALNTDEGHETETS